MSEDIKIHHTSRPLSGHSEGDVTTDDWTKVTCGGCKLEQPPQEVAGRVEYRTPANVLATDASFADPSLAELKAQHAARRLEAVRVSEEFALRTMEYWTKVWRDAVILRRALEQESGVGQGTPEPLNPAQAISGVADAFWRDMAGAFNVSGYALRHAPVSAVDIRTDPEDTEDMANTEQLSKQAKSALMNAQPHQGAQVSCDPATFLQLFQASPALIGPEGGLTRAGTIARQKLVQAAEDAAFG